MKGESEFREFKDCTFKPNTNTRIKADIRPQIDSMVRGIDNVKRRKQLIEKRKQEKIEREKEVFDYASRYDSNPAHQSHTVPQPFNLSKVNRESPSLLLSSLSWQQTWSPSFRFIPKLTTRNRKRRSPNS